MTPPLFRNSRQLIDESVVVEYVFDSFHRYYGVKLLVGEGEWPIHIRKYIVISGIIDVSTYNVEAFLPKTITQPTRASRYIQNVCVYLFDTAQYFSEDNAHGIGKFVVITEFTHRFYLLSVASHILYDVSCHGRMSVT